MNDHQPSHGDEFLSIGTFARRSRLSARALRLYESNGLLVPASVDPATGYRFYRHNQLSTARLIRMLRHLGMPLSQITIVIDADADDQRDLIQQYWRSAESDFATRRFLAEHLQITLSPQERNYPMFTVTTRDIAEQLVLTEQRHVTADILPDFIGAALGRQHGALARAGSVPTAPSFVVYHGEVTEDSDGPVETCTPVTTELAATLDLPTRVEPAHREAFTTISRAQVVYPQIMSAYAAVEAWVAAQGLTLSGAPREVYFTNFDSVGPDEPAVDIAFVIGE